MPDLDAVDWKGMRAMNDEYLGSDRWVTCAILNGHWERLMSLMDVEGAAMALIDEDQEDALLDFFEEYSAFMDDYIGRIHDTCPEVDAIMVHDDWCHANGPFFSEEVARKLLLPYKKRLVESCHKRDLFYEQHSCGKNERFVQMYIEAGVDLYCPQDINDFDAILEQTRGSNLVIGLPDEFLPDEMPERDKEAAAAAWFEKYKDNRIVTYFFMPDPTFQKEIYRLSREYYYAV